MAQHKTSTGERASLLIASAVLAILWISAGSFATEGARRHDFLNIYTGATLALDGQWNRLHDLEAQLAVERQNVPNLRELVPFVRPHFYALLIAPLALLSFNTAFWSWIALQTALYCGFGAWAAKRFGLDALIYWLLFAPGALGISHGQDAPVMLAVILAGFVLAEHGRLHLAGVVWSLALMKFHLCLGLILALAASRQWKVIAGFSAGGAGLTLVSVALAGREGVAHYVSMLTNKNLERLSPGPQQMTNIQGIMANFGVDSAWFALAAGLIAGALIVRCAWNAPIPGALTGGLAGGLFIVPHAYLYDTTMLLLPLILGVQPRQPKPVRLAAFALITPIVPLLALFDPPVSAAPAVALLVFLAVSAYCARPPAPTQAATA